MTKDRIVAVGPATQLDLQVLSQGFYRRFPAPFDDKFGDLLRLLDDVDAVNIGVTRA